MENENTLQAKDLDQQGVALFRAGNVEAALEKYQQAMDIEPMLADSYRNMGDLYLATEKYQDAKNYYKKALLIEKNGEIYFQYGNACFLNDEPHEGLEYYNLALSAGFDSDEMFFFMGMAYEHMNDDAMALRYIQKAIAKNPSRPDYKVKKISVLLRMNMMEEAKEAVEELLRNDPELYDGYHMKTAILLEEKKYPEAILCAKEAAERFPDDADLMYDYANATALSGAYEQALQIISNAKQMKYFEDAKARFCFMEAEICAELGNMDRAIEKCDECISLETEQDFFSDARFMRINLALAKNDFESALQHAEQFIEKGARDSYYYAALYFRPFCLSKLGKEEAAEKYYKEAISLYRMATLQNLEVFDAYLYRAMCLKEIRQYEEALKLLEFIENMSNQIAEVHTIRADVYKLTGKEGLAKEELEKAFQLKPELKAVYSEGGE